jgi:hypothetical protein
MTFGAVVTETARNMVRVCCLLKIRLVALETVDVLQLVVAIQVT